jgi:hypothetical protein
VSRFTWATARKAPSDLPGAQAQAARHEPRGVAWAPEAKQISDRGCVWRWTAATSTPRHVAQHFEADRSVPRPPLSLKHFACRNQIQSHNFCLLDHRDGIVTDVADHDLALRLHQFEISPGCDSCFFPVSMRARLAIYSYLKTSTEVFLNPLPPIYVIHRQHSTLYIGSKTAPRSLPFAGRLTSAVAPKLTSISQAMSTGSNLNSCCALRFTGHASNHRWRVRPPFSPFMKRVASRTVR